MSQCAGNCNCDQANQTHTHGDGNAFFAIVTSYSNNEYCRKCEQRYGNGFYHRRQQQPQVIHLHIHNGNSQHNKSSQHRNNNTNTTPCPCQRQHDSNGKALPMSQADVMNFLMRGWI